MNTNSTKISSFRRVSVSNLANFTNNMFLDLICSLEPENFRKKPIFSSFLSDFVIAKSDLEYVNSLPVTMVTEMQYPDVYTENNSVNISIAMDFYAVFRTDIVINQGKTVFNGSKSPIMVLTHNLDF